MKDYHSKAMDSMFGDLDDMESKRMFESPQQAQGGFSVTITMNPNESHEAQEKEEGVGNDSGMEDLPANMAAGGMVPPPRVASMGEPDDMGLPPFLRKKKK